MLLVTSYSHWIDRHLSRVIQWALKRWTRLDVRDYWSLLRFQNHYSVSEIVVKEGDWLAEKPLIELALLEEGILILGIQRKSGQYIGTPTGRCRVCPGDVAILYGRTNELTDIDERKAGPEGDAAHAKAVEEHKDFISNQSNKQL